MKRKDIEVVLRKLGASEFKYTTDWIMTNCILAEWTHEHGRDSNPSFGVKEGFGVSPAHCFSCGFSGGLISLIREYAKYALPEGKIRQEEIDELIDFILISEEDTGDLRMTGMMLDQPVVVPHEIEDMLNLYHEYFAERGIGEDIAQKWNLGWHEMDERVLFPVFVKEGKHNRLVGVAGRTVCGEEPKYRNYPPKFKKSDHLYGGWLKPDEAKKIVVVEGPIDVIQVNKAFEVKGLKEYWCVGLLGADPSASQLNQLVELGEEVILMLDNDSSGKVGSIKVAGGSVGQKRYKGIGERTLVSIVFWPEGVKDAGELTVDQIVELIESRGLILEERLRRELRL